MGYYINPQGESKESYLAKNGTKLTEAPKWNDIPEDKVSVCLVDNGLFTAAGICYSERELATFKENDGRPKKWFLVPNEAAEAASDWKKK